MQRSTSHTLVCAITALVVGLTDSAALTAQASPPDDRVSASECCTALLFPIGARAVSLGTALTARNGPDALFLNPASLAGLAKNEFRVHNVKTEIEVSNTFAFAFRVRAAGTMGLSYQLFDQGTSEATDEFGNKTGELRVLEHFLLATFATELTPGVAAGVSYKLYQYRQDCSGFCNNTQFAATTHGVDLGVQFHPRLWPALQMGASVVHLSLPLQVVNAEQASAPPTRVRAGAAYEAMHHFSADTTMQLWTSLDVAASWRSGVEQTIGGGLELILDRTIFVRSGYSTGTGRNAGAAVGLGLRYDRFDVGIAKSFVRTTVGGADPVNITFAITF